MGFLKGLTSFFLSTLFILSLIILMLAFSLQPLLHEDIYLNFLEKTQAYERLDNTSESQQRSGVELLSFNDTQPIIEHLLTNTLDYVRDESNTLNITVTLNQTRLREFFEESARGVRICEVNESSYEGDEVQCRPANKTYTEFLDEVLLKEGFNISNMTELNLQDTFDKQNNLLRLKNIITAVRASVFASFIILILLAFLVFMFITRALKALFMWIGRNTAIAGALGIILALGTGKILLAVGPESDFFILFLGEFVSVILNRLLAVGIVLAAVGVILFVIGRVIKRK